MPYYILLLLLCFFTHPVFAATAEGRDEAACKALAREIREDFDKSRACWEDTECTTTLLECPFRGHYCTQTIISLSEPDRLQAARDKITRFRKDCIDTVPDYQTFCERFEREAAQLDCKPLTVMCINGTCVDQMEAIMQGGGVIDEVLNHPAFIELQKRKQQRKQKQQANEKRDETATD